jgi:hypothetical protein
LSNIFYIIPRIGGIAYLNIAKSACSSILLALSQMRLKKGFYPPRDRLSDGSLKIHGFRPRHAHLDYFFSRWPIEYPSLPDSFITFTFVRNPYYRFLSFYISKIVNRQEPIKFYEKLGIKKGCSFSECVKIITSINPEKLEQHVMPQKMIILPKNDPIVDFIGKVEKFEKDWDTIQKITGMPIELGFENVTNKNNRAYYTEGLRNAIYNYYKDDFELFGYNKYSVETIDGDDINFEKDIYIKEQLSENKIEQFKEKLNLSNRRIKELAVEFDNNPNKREIFFSQQNESFNELLLKIIHYTNNKLNNYDSEMKKYISELKLLRKNLNIQKNQLESSNNNIKQLIKNIKEQNSLMNEHHEEYYKFKDNALKHYFEAYRSSQKSILKRIKRIIKYRIPNEKKFISKLDGVDPYFYFTKYPDTISSGISATDHYVRFGAAEGRNPSENFNTNLYIYENPEIVFDGVNPLAHFLKNTYNSEIKPKK